MDILDKKDFNSTNLKKIIDDNDPDYIIIEYNGVWDVSDLLSIKFPRGYEIRNLFNIVDYNTFDSFLSNMENIMVDKISNCDVTIVTRSNIGQDKNCTKKEFDDFKQKCDAISHINSACSIYVFEDLFKDEKKYDFITQKVTRSDAEILKFFGFIVIFFGAIFAFKTLGAKDSVGEFERGVWIFISLILQILPFILIGSIVSGIISVFVSSSRLFKIFEKTSIKSIFLSLFIGILFPVCDCAMVPIANYIAKKGYSIPVTITFLLAAPALNPIVIISTYYAFPQMPMMVVYRIVFGLLIAFIAGIIMMISEKIKDGKYGKGTFKNQAIRENISKYKFSNNDLVKPKFDGKIGYIEAIINHCRQEFFKIGPYIILGAFISTVIQIAVPKSVFLGLNKINFVAVLIMILASIFISICSTSNAFIARSFYNIMPINAIMAFVVMGPLLDITNISVMSSTFKKKFMAKLILLLIYISCIIFALMKGGVSIV